MVTSLRKWRRSRDTMQPLSSLDWRVIDMARADGPRSLNPDGLIARFARDFLGLQVARGLANESLEQLRRFSVRAWYWDLVRGKDIRRLFDAGYTKTHVAQILAHIARLRGFAPSIQEDFA
jgi:hypothetical protein